MPSLASQYNNLTNAEKQYLQKHPAHAYYIYQTKEKAFQETALRFGGNRRNDKSDAFRHCYWSALLAKEIGAENAYAFTTAHENWKGNPANERAMDLFNNAIGIKIGKTKKADHVLASMCFSALMSGSLNIIAP